MLHTPPTNLLLLATKEEQYTKSLPSNKRFFFLNSGKSSAEWTSTQKKKDKTERILGLGRRTREEMVKWNQMTARDSRQGGDTDLKKQKWIISLMKNCTSLGVQPA